MLSSMAKRFQIYLLIFALYSLTQIVYPQDLLITVVLSMLPFVRFKIEALVISSVFFMLGIVFAENELLRLGLILVIIFTVIAFLERHSILAEKLFFNALLVILAVNALSLVPGLDLAMEDLTKFVVYEESMNWKGANTRDAVYYLLERPHFLTRETSYAAKMVLVALFMTRRNTVLLLISSMIILRSPVLILGLLHPNISGRINIRGLLIVSIGLLVMIFLQYERLNDILALKDLSTIQRIVVPLIAFFSFKSILLGTTGGNLYQQTWITEYLPEYLLDDGYVAPHLLRVIIEWGLLGVIYIFFIINVRSLRSLTVILLFGLTSDLTYTPYPWLLFSIMVYGNNKLEKV